LFYVVRIEYNARVDPITIAMLLGGLAAAGLAYKAEQKPLKPARSKVSHSPAAKAKQKQTDVDEISGAADVGDEVGDVTAPILASVFGTPAAGAGVGVAETLVSKELTPDEQLDVFTGGLVTPLVAARQLDPKLKL
jgi:hypothetical protein